MSLVIQNRPLCKEDGPFISEFPHFKQDYGRSKEGTPIASITQPTTNDGSYS